jgi:o-succinylbenzoate synthase
MALRAALRGGTLRAMSLFVHRYSLRPRSGGAPRQGALIRVDRGVGDVHPWPELGDAPLDEQLALLARGETTTLTRASLHWARVDGEARERGVSLFAGLTVPLSHWPGNEPPPAFDTIKIKGVVPVPPHVRVRIDFNARLSPAEFLRVADGLPKEQIDFIEDPCPYDPGVWRELRQRTGLRLALDRFEGVADVLVHKPALHATFPAFDGEVVVTSYMDHPVGQCFAAYVAASNPVSARCGLFTHVLYEPDPFIERLGADGARLLPPEGTGIGFDDLLENLAWTKTG